LANHQYFCNIGHSPTQKPKCASHPKIEACIIMLPFGTPFKSYIHGNWSMVKQYGIKYEVPLGMY
jgi:hypothetical protein